MTSIWVRGAAAALLCCVAATAAGATARERLDDFLRDLDSLEAEFRQTLLDEAGRPVDESSGFVYLQRPGRFRWDYRAPYRQLIVADGEKLWLYDIDLEQVTVQSQAGALGATPAALLSSKQPVEENFDVRELGARDDGSVWLALTPKASGASFERIRLGFADAALTTMELEDGFGQTTRLEFLAVRRNPGLDPALFRFTPPPGVDVVQGR